MIKFEVTSEMVKKNLILRCWPLFPLFHESVSPLRPVRAQVVQTHNIVVAWRSGASRGGIIRGSKG